VFDVNMFFVRKTDLQYKSAAFATKCSAENSSPTSPTIKLQFAM